MLDAFSAAPRVLMKYSDTAKTLHKSICNVYLHGGGGVRACLVLRGMGMGPGELGKKGSCCLGSILAASPEAQAAEGIYALCN